MNLFHLIAGGVLAAWEVVGRAIPTKSKAFTPLSWAIQLLNWFNNGLNNTKPQ